MAASPVIHQAGRHAAKQETHCGEPDDDRGNEPRHAASSLEFPLVGIRKLLVANRGEIAAARVPHLSRARHRDGRGRRARRRRGAARPLGRRDGRDRELPPLRGAHPRGEGDGADAIHPGYGFLAENADFAEAVEAAGLTWVGPPPEALRLGGDKLAAKRIAREAGVPTLPEGSPEEIGFPLVVKAAAGGGGRGMRVVRSAAELDEALEAAEREALGAFGDGTLYLERYLERPRHVEVQLLADAHGNVVALGERDCSVQRRHQKVLEEAPAPGLDPRCARRSSRRPSRSARAIGYRSAGTVEFVVEDGAFHFLELNGRIQVEHPVTEAVTGLDLIAEQLRIAEGETARTDSDVHGDAKGHAVEVRLYAEDPRTFLPQAGRIERLRLPSYKLLQAFLAASGWTPASRRATRSGSRTTR